jgi:hypothetical protein
MFGVEQMLAVRPTSVVVIPPTEQRLVVWPTSVAVRPPTE